MPPAEPPGASPTAGSTPTRNRAEGVAPDRDYADRKGYDPAFLEGQIIAIPRPTDTNLLAPLVMGGDELKYTHFSVLLHRDRRMPLVTATNIDGERYLKILRSTGKPAKAEAGDVWYDDPRVDPIYYLGGAF